MAGGASQTDAAISAGYSRKSAVKQGARLQTNADILARIRELASRASEKAELSAVRTLEELRRLAFADIRTLFDASGNLRPIHSLSQEEAACIAGFEVIIKNAQAGDGITDTVHKVKVLDKTKSLEMLAKHFALLVERIDVTGNIQLFDRLANGRKRMLDERAKSR